MLKLYMFLASSLHVFTLLELFWQMNNQPWGWRSCYHSLCINEDCMASLKGLLLVNRHDSTCWHDKTSLHIITDQISCVSRVNGISHTSIFFAQDDSCLIDGRCVMTGDTHTESNCFICDPSQSINQWTQLPGWLTSTWYRVPKLNSLVPCLR